jgi:hypothetical protein
MENLMNIDLLTRRIKREFAKYLRRSGHTSKTLAMYLPNILRSWVALPERCQQFQIDTLSPNQWQSIENVIVSEYRERWRTKANKAKERNQKRSKKNQLAIAQLPLDL